MNEALNDKFPLVSVVMPSYNHERFIEEAVRSVWLQTYPNVELIVIDDGSKDSSTKILDVLQPISPIPMLVIFNQNQGLCKTLNHCLSLAKGEFITVLASDDKYTPDRTMQLVSSFKLQPANVGMIYSNYMLMNLDSAVIGSKPNQKEIYCGNIFEPLLLKGNFIHPLTIMVKKEVFNQIGGYDESLRFEDWDLFLKIARHYEVNYLETVTAYYRVSFTGLMSTLRYKDWFMVLNKYVYLLTPIKQRQAISFAYFICARFEIQYGKFTAGVPYLLQSIKLGKPKFISWGIIFKLIMKRLAFILFGEKLYRFVKLLKRKIKND